MEQGIKNNEQGLFVSVTIKNTGNYDGKEVVQVYVSDLLASITRPVKELKAFQKINLKAGESRVVEFYLAISELAFWNIDNKKVVEPGKFKIMVGTNSDEGLEAEIEVK